MIFMPHIFHARAAWRTAPGFSGEAMRRPAVVIALLFLAGCGPEYVPIDGSAPDPRRRQVASTICNGEKDAATAGMSGDDPGGGLDQAAAGAQRLSTALSVFAGCMARQGYIEKTQ